MLFNHELKFIMWSLTILVIIMLSGCSPTRSNQTSYVRPTSPPVIASTSPPVKSTSITPGSGTFSMATVNTRRPSNIREEMDLFSGGGPGPSCTFGDPATVVVWPGDNNNQIEVFPISKSDTSVGDITIFTCGWASTGNLPVIITLPDGTVRNRTTQVRQSSNGGLEAYLYLDLGRNPQLGSYQVKFDGRSRNIYANFRVIKPSGPRLYTLPNRDVMLWNFRSNESVILYAYKTANTYYGDTATFIAYQEFLTDGNGTLHVNVNMSQADTFVAVGTRTGQVSDSAQLRPIIMGNIQR